MSKGSQIDKNVRKMKVRIYSIIFIFCILLIVIFMFNSNLFFIERVSILNNGFLSDEEILSLSGIEVSDNIFKVKISDIHDKLVEHPRIKEVDVSRRLPNKIIIDVLERHEFIAINYIGIYFIVDSEGYIINSMKENLGLYEVSGLEVVGYKDGSKIETLDDKLLESIMKIAKYVEMSNLDFIPNFIVENDEINMYINQNFIVRFGDGSQIEDRFNKFNAIYADLRARTISSGIININHNGYPSYIPYDG